MHVEYRVRSFAIGDSAGTVFTARGCIVPGEPTDYDGINAQLNADVERRKGQPR